MGEILKINGGNIATVLHGQHGLDIGKPFAKQIYLVDAHIAGTTHVDNINEIEPRLEVGKRLKFLREADNKYDKQAIVVKDEDNHKIGYVPKDKNEILSRLMDAGKLVYGTIREKEYIGDWLKITMQVYLDD